MHMKHSLKKGSYFWVLTIICHICGLFMIFPLLCECLAKQVWKANFSSWRIAMYLEFSKFLVCISKFKGTDFPCRIYKSGLIHIEAT